MKVRSRILLAALSAMLFNVAQAQVAPRSYAVMSLVGDAISVYGVRPSVGSRTDAETRTVLPISEPVFDTAALVAADAAIKAFQPSAKVVLMMTQDPGLYQAQNAMFEAPQANLDNRLYLIGLLKERAVTHLLLITRERANARFPLAYGYAGKGTLEGLGFYLDETLEFSNTKTSDRSSGMLGPFAYVRVRLLDAATLALVRETKATRSLILAQPSATPSAMALWTSLPAPKKIAYIEDLLGAAMHEAIPGVLAQ